MAVSFSSVNPLSKVNLGGSMGKLGSIALVVGISLVIIALVAGIIYWYSVKKKYWIIIEVSRIIGGVPMRVATYCAREVPFGMAGDKLWCVKSSGFWKIKTIKWLPVGELQSAPRLFKYWIRSDGEWINYQDDNIDEISRKMGVRFVQADMRLQRLATERLLEQRLLNKTWWEKWGTTTMMIIFFLVITVCMVIQFYQWGKLLDKFTQIEGVQLETAKILYRTFGEGYITSALNSTGGTTGLIPV